MIPSLPITAIIDRWLEVLPADVDIEAYCQSHWGKSPKIYLGIPRKMPPTEKDCPYIVIIPGAKEEGGDLADYTYVFTVGWAIVDKDEDITGNVIRQPGATEINELGQLILKALTEASMDKSVSNLTYEIDLTGYQPQIVGEMQVQIAMNSRDLNY